MATNDYGRFAVLCLSDALPNGGGGLFVIHDKSNSTVICGRRTLHTSDEFCWDKAEGVRLSSDGLCNSAHKTLTECDSITVNQSGLVYTVVASCEEGRVYCIWDATLGHLLGHVDRPQQHVFGATDVIACGRLIFAQAHSWNECDTSTESIDYTLALGIHTPDSNLTVKTEAWRRIFGTSNGAQQAFCCDPIRDRVLIYSKISTVVLVVTHCSRTQGAAGTEITIELVIDMDSSIRKDVTHASMDCGTICTAVNTCISRSSLVFYIWTMESMCNGIVTPTRMYNKHFNNPCTDTDHISHVHNIRCISASGGIWVSYIIDAVEEEECTGLWDTTGTRCMIMLINKDFNRTYTKFASSDTDNLSMVRSVDGESVYLNNRLYTCSVASVIADWLT